MATNTTLIKQRARLLLKRHFSKRREMYHLPEEEREHLRREAREIVDGDRASLSMTEKGILLQVLLDEVFGFGPLGPLLRNKSVRELSIFSDLKIVTLPSSKLSELEEFESEDHFELIASRLLHPKNLSKEGVVTMLRGDGVYVKYDSTPSKPERDPVLAIKKDVVAEA